MSESPHGSSPNTPPDAPPDAIPGASLAAPSRFHWIWLIPLVAAAVAIYLGVETLRSRGPMITITFANGQGLTAGQTKVEHNAVALGTVRSVTLSDDYKQVIARVRMTKHAAGLLTSHARFWVVRPRLSLTDISGLQTLVSGSYIAVDPGPAGGTPTQAFRGLDQPPGVQSDQPGRVFTLRAPRLGWLSEGAPVFYHDVAVGRLLDYQEPGMSQPILMHVFIKAPYDAYVRTETHFWNTSGLTANFGPNGVHVAVESTEALLAGGISFDNFKNAEKSPSATGATTFELFDSFDDAQNAGFRDNIHFVTYFNQSVAGLQVGSAVQLFGIRVGTVTGTQLLLDPDKAAPNVRVTFDVQPERIFAPKEIPKQDPLAETRKLVGMGLRARLDTNNLLTGQEVVGLDMSPHPSPAGVTTEGDRIVMPSQSGGLQNVTDTLSDLASRLDAIEFDKLGRNANNLLGSLQGLVASADAGLKPLATDLPAMSKRIQATLLKTDRLLSSMQAAYGASSDTHQNLQQLTRQATEAVRSIRELTTYLNAHPGAVVWGRK